MTEPEIIVERKKYGSSAMDYTMRVYQKLDEETIMIDGVKYQKVEEPKPQILKDIIREWIVIYNVRTDGIRDHITNDLVDRIEKKWLPDEDDGDDRYACGWNDCVEKLKLRLK